MAVDRNAPDMRALRVLLPEQHWARLESAIDGATRVGLEAEGIHHYLRTHHMSESDRLLLTLAYSLWRGFGPSLDVHALWGMDSAVTARVLASLAAAVDPENAIEILESSIQMLRASDPPVAESAVAEHPADPHERNGTQTGSGKRRKPKLAVARE
jgi:hypothetical protein